MFIKDLKAKIERKEIEFEDKRKFLQDASNLWAQLDEAEKDKYRNTAKEQKEAYHAYLKEAGGANEPEADDEEQL